MQWRKTSNSSSEWRHWRPRMLPWTAKRNPRVYKGKYITITRRPDGTLKPNFRPLPANMSVERYAFGVYIELHKALEGLIEK